MTIRKITQIVRQMRNPRTFLFLECGHHRSIGGGVLLFGNVVGNVALMREYDCQDGHCATGSGSTA